MAKSKLVALPLESPSARKTQVSRARQIIDKSKRAVRKAINFSTAKPVRSGYKTAKELRGVRAPFEPDLMIVDKFSAVLTSFEELLKPLTSLVKSQDKVALNMVSRTSARSFRMVGNNWTLFLELLTNPFSLKPVEEYLETTGKLIGENLEELENFSQALLGLDFKSSLMLLMESISNSEDARRIVNEILHSPSTLALIGKCLKKSWDQFNHLKAIQEEQFPGQPLNVMQLAVESLGVLPNHLLQFVAEDRRILERIPGTMFDIVLNTRSEQHQTFTKEQMQQKMDRDFGKGLYTVVGDKARVGTVGEVWIADNTRIQRAADAKMAADGPLEDALRLAKERHKWETVAGKAIKYGVTEEGIQLEAELGKTIMKLVITEPEMQQAFSRVIDEVTNATIGELDLRNDMTGAYRMIFSQMDHVHITKPIGMNGDKQVLLMQQAPGITLDRLERMLTFARAKAQLIHDDPDAFMELYYRKFAHDIQENSWLDRFLEIREQLPDIYLSGTLSMLTRIPGSWPHDPHPGNITINYDEEKGTYSMHFIDVQGLLMKPHETFQQIFGHIVDWVVANSEGLATLFIDLAAPDSLRGTNHKELCQKLAQSFEERLFNRSFDLRANAMEMHEEMEKVLAEHGVYYHHENTSKLKAIIHISWTYATLLNLTGQDPNMLLHLRKTMKMMPKGIRSDLAALLAGQKTMVIPKTLQLLTHVAKNPNVTAWSVLANLLPSNSTLKEKLYSFFVNKMKLFSTAGGVM